MLLKIANFFRYFFFTLNLRLHHIIFNMCFSTSQNQNASPTKIANTSLQWQKPSLPSFKIHYSKNFSHRLENCFYVFLIRLSNTICIEVDLWAKNFDTKLGLGWLNFWQDSLRAPSIFVLYETIDKLWFPNYLLLCTCIIVVIFCCFVKTKVFIS